MAAAPCNTQARLGKFTILARAGAFLRYRNRTPLSRSQKRVEREESVSEQHEQVLQTAVMTLFVVGINHETAPVELREKVAFGPDQIGAALQRARQEAGVEEVAILSTCNRTEIYAAGDEDDRLLAWLADYHGLGAEQLSQCSYRHHDDAAIRHLMRVASGLDSLILGEPQILGQVKDAYLVAQQEATLGGFLNQAFQQVFSTAKRVRSETAIGQNPVSVAYAAVSLSQQIFSDLHKVTALLIGAGETIELVARHLREKQVGRLLVANRTLDRARVLGDQVAAEPIVLADIPDHLHHADIVISSTAAPLPILGKGAVESALRKRRRRPMFMVDIAVPRDIEPEVEKLDDVFLYTVDDLREVIDENVRTRAEAATEAERIILEAVNSWQRQVRALDAVSTIRAVRQHVESLRDAELEKSLAALQAGQDPEELMRQLARGLTNKLLHEPTRYIRAAGEEGLTTRLGLVQDLFGISTNDTPSARADQTPPQEPSKR